MFDIRRILFQPHGGNDQIDDLYLEMFGKTSQLNSWYYLRIYFTDDIHPSIQDSNCILIPDNHEIGYYWKLTINLIDDTNHYLSSEQLEDIQHLDILPHILTNHDFNWWDYSIPPYIWIVITGFLITDC